MSTGDDDAGGARHDAAGQVRDVLSRHREEEQRDALRALLRCPLMTSAHPEFGAVRRHAQALRDWFSQSAGWMLQVDLDCARLYKRPADTGDATRGAADFDRRRYILFCLACAVLERAEPQITLRSLGEKLLVLAAEPELAACAFSFTLESHHERRELVAICRYLLALGVLQRVAGDEDAFVSQLGDALYDVQRRALAGLLAASRGPSTWPAGSAPQTLDARLAALTEEFAPDSEEGRRTVMRHHLARRLLDDPVVYFDDLDAAPALRAYFQNQRGALAARLCEATGLTPEQRAEGLALVDDTGELTDVAMPAIGTASHVTLLVAEFLARAERGAPGTAVGEQAVQAFVRDAASEFGRYWSKAARAPGAEAELAGNALLRLASLRLVHREAGAVRALPALARFALGQTDIVARKAASTHATRGAQTDLFA
jgi:uncharacterized protein (TIGR02678 family)